METVETLFWQIFPVLLTIAVPTVIVLFTWLARKVSIWLSLGNQLNVEALIMGLVEQGVCYAEQLAANKKKENDEIHGEEKLHLAVEFIISELNKYGIFTITAQEIANKVEAYLGQMALATSSLPDALGDDSEEDGI